MKKAYHFYLELDNKQGQLQMNEYVCTVCTNTSVCVFCCAFSCVTVCLSGCMHTVGVCAHLPAGACICLYGDTKRGEGAHDQSSFGNL